MNERVPKIAEYFEEYLSKDIWLILPICYLLGYPILLVYEGQNFLTLSPFDKIIQSIPIGFVPLIFLLAFYNILFTGYNILLQENSIKEIGRRIKLVFKPNEIENMEKAVFEQLLIVRLMTSALIISLY